MSAGRSARARRAHAKYAVSQNAHPYQPAQRRLPRPALRFTLSVRRALALSLSLVLVLALNPLSVNPPAQNQKAYADSAENIDGGGVLSQSACLTKENEAPLSSAYTDWRAVAQGVESGALDDPGFKPIGSGSAADPYVIETPEAFAWWALLHCDESATLTADVDLTARNGEQIDWPGDTVLSGSLDGQGHRVSFHTLGTGLFSGVSASGAVRWLTLGAPLERSAAVQSAGPLAGSLAGYNSGALEGVMNFMAVSGARDGLDDTSGVVEGRAADAAVGAASPLPPAGGVPAQRVLAGGIVAVNDGSIKDCANQGPVANGSADATSAAGGIAAEGGGTIATSYNAGDVCAEQGGAYVITSFAAPAGYDAVVDAASCYLAPGDGADYEGVSGADAARPGAVSSEELQAAAERLNDGRTGADAPWMAGEGAGAYPSLRSLVTLQASAPDSLGASNVLATAPRSESRTWEDFAHPGWTDIEARNRGIIGGDGVLDHPYVIHDAEGLAWWAYKVNHDPGTSTTWSSEPHEGTNIPYNKSCVKLAEDIDLSGFSHTGQSAVGSNYANCLQWVPIGGAAIWDIGDSGAFAGNFECQGHAISNLRVQERPYKSGLFGQVANAGSSGGGNARSGTGIIRGVRVTSGYVHGTDRVGGIVGQVNGAVQVTDCSNAATIVSDTNISGGTSCNTGGVVGCSLSAPGLVIDHCCNRGSVSASREAGGLYGFSNNCQTTIKASYNTGEVNSTQNCGGIVGTGTSTSLISCYNAGKVAGPGGSLSGYSASASNCYYANDIGSATNTSLGTPLSSHYMRSWDFAYHELNGNNYVGPGGASSTTWTQDGLNGAPEVNGGYPIFGNLDIVQQTVTLDPAAAARSADGSVTVNLPRSLSGTVTLLAELDVSNFDGASLVRPDEVRAGFNTWGTVNANQKIALQVGSDLSTHSASGSTLSTRGASEVTLNAAAAYDYPSARSVSLVVKTPSYPSRIVIKLSPITSKTLDVTVPVEQAGGSFALAPDGTAHTLGGGAGHEAALAAGPSVFKNNGSVPVSVELSSVTAAPVNPSAGITAALSPGTQQLADSADSVTDAGNTRLGVTTAVGAGAGGNTAAPAFDRPLWFAPGTDGAAGTVPLAFFLPGTSVGSDPYALAWRYVMEYAGTYVGDPATFSFDTVFTIGLPANDVTGASVAPVPSSRGAGHG